jgi:hypothetical protein
MVAVVSNSCMVAVVLNAYMAAVVLNACMAGACTWRMTVCCGNVSLVDIRSRRSGGCCGRATEVRG